MKILTFKIYSGVTSYILLDCVEAFRELGHTVETIVLPKSGVILKGDFVKKINSFKPDFIFTINHLGIVGPLFTSMEIPYSSWFVDAPTYWIKEEDISSYCCIFSWDRTHLEDFKGLGLENVSLLRFGTNPRIFRRIDLTQDERVKYDCDVSFIGRSAYRFYRECCLDKKSDPRIQAIIDEVIELKNQNILQDIPDLLKQVEDREKYSLGFQNQDERRYFMMSLECARDAMYRKQIIESLKGLDLHIYGDEGWKRLLEDGIKWHSRIDYHQDLPRLYNATRINLAINTSQKTGIDPRVLDVSSCGSFILTDYREDQDVLFEPDEVVVYDDGEDLYAKIEYFLKHPKERMEIARLAHERVLKEHTYRHRMRELIEKMSLIFNLRME